MARSSRFKVRDYRSLVAAARKDLGRRLRIECRLRDGRAWETFLAWDLTAGHPVALNLLSRDDLDTGAVERFRRSAGRATYLHHPHLLPVHEFGITDDLLWYTSAYMGERPLAYLIWDEGPMALRPCLRVVEQVAEALHYGHRRNLVHGGLTSGTVLTDVNAWTYVSDFSIDAALPHLTGVESAPEDRAQGELRVYRAPEQEDGGPAGPWTDQYALAIFTLECLTGRAPYRHDLLSGLDTVRTENGNEPRTVPDHLVAALERALDEQPGNRFPDVLEFTASVGGATPPEGRVSRTMVHAG